jgi:hypothetical protein
MSASYIHDVISTQHVNFAVLFSSTSTFGGFGIAVHSAANAFLDAIARCARASGLQRTSLVVPGILGVGAGAAIALKSVDAEDPAVRAMSLTTDELMQSIQLVICKGDGSLRGPLQSVLDPLKGGALPISWLLRDAFNPSSRPVNRNLTPYERLSAARAAFCALDDAMVAMSSSPPVHAEVLVVGAGITGLTVAAAMTEVGADLFILERRGSVGGVWRSYGKLAAEI